MIRQYKWQIALTTILILLPAVFGLCVWDRLPEQMPTHFDASGTPDDYSSRFFAVVGLPLILVGIHLLCFVMTSLDPKNKGQHIKLFAIVLWICPIISLVMNAAVYTYAFGQPFDISKIVLILMGVLFIVLGNYMPKCRQNHTIGIKVPWTLMHEPTWNATHRLAGKLWVICGLIVLACLFLPGAALVWVLPAVLILMAIAPMVYAYLYYKKHV